MKANIHPVWYPEAKVTCVCGNNFVVGSTLPAIKVEICNLCHPFFTGQQKYVDTLGQVEKFSKKKEIAEAKKAERIKVLQNRVAKIQETKKEKPSLKDLLMQVRKTTS